VSRVTKVLNRLGTADSVSWPVFWLTFVAGIIGNFSAVQTGAALWIRVVIIISAQIALFIPLVIMRVFLLQRSNRPHPFVVLTVFVIAVLCRALTVNFLSYHFFPDDPTPLLDRIIGNYLNIGLVLVISAYAVSLIRERRYHISQLENLRQELEQSINVVSSELSQRNDATVDRIRDVLEKELSQLDRDNPRSSLAILHDTATYVVRPLSHDLARGMPEIAPLVLEADRSTIRWSTALDRIATGKPFLPILTAFLLMVEIVAVVATLGGSVVGVVAGPFVLAASLTASNWIFQRFSPTWGARLRILLMVLLAAISGALAGLVIWTLLGSGPRGWALGVGGAVMSALLALVVSVGAGVTRERDRMIANLTQSARDLERSLIRRKQTQWLQNKSLSRALHGPVQTAVNAAAIKLDEALRSGDVSADVIDQIRTELLASLDVLGSSNGGVVSLAQGMERIEKTWEGICDVHVSLSNEAMQQLNSDVIVRSCFIDMVTEAVSNAIRHGQSTDVAVFAVVENDDLILDVRDNGTPPEGASEPGLGSTLLDDCTVSWAMQSTDSGHHLKAVIPA
jgi:signal transduction histidine kinase